MGSIKGEAARFPVQTMTREERERGTGVAEQRAQEEEDRQRALEELKPEVQPRICLRACYAVRGTAVAYATRSRAMRWAVLI
eukprot:1901099-Rhodomonas_salina.2